MQRLTIRHETHYSYERPVAFTEHRLLLRPRDGHSLNLIEASLVVSPPGEVRWIYDALGNCVCLFTPRSQARTLTITSTMTVDRYPAYVELPLDNPHSALPMVYSPEDRPVLAPFVQPVTEDHPGVNLSWLRQYMHDPAETALDVIKRLNEAIHSEFTYGARYEEGVQHPADTIRMKSGTCRDFAWLMVETLRRMGFAARFITGYLYSARAELRGTGATHAWCEVFLPHLGWIELDPTNGLIESPDLIPIAVTRTPAEAAPISGAIIGSPGQSHM
ncbi:MAG: transglutaminase family protein, partial [Hyphomicrobiales bacterium]